jgi:hypothetical protein
MWFGTIVLICSTILIFFTMEETMYFRSTVEGVADDTIDGVAVHNEANKEITEMVKEGVNEPGTITVTNTSSRSQFPVREIFMPERTYSQKLNLFVVWPNRPTPKEHLIMMWRPLVIFFQFPNVT